MQGPQGKYMSQFKPDAKGKSQLAHVRFTEVNRNITRCFPSSRRKRPSDVSILPEFDDATFIHRLEHIRVARAHTQEEGDVQLTCVCTSTCLSQSATFHKQLSREFFKMFFRVCEK